MTRPAWPAASGLLICAAALLALRECGVPRPVPQHAALPPVHIDTTIIDRAVNVQAIRDSIAIAVRDSLRQLFLVRPIREVIRWLPAGDTIRDTAETLTPDATIRASADSLATCHQQRDSLAGAGGVAATRDSLLRAALDSANRRACPAQDPQPVAPSRATWAAVGAGVILGAEAIAAGAALFFFGGN